MSFCPIHPFGSELASFVNSGVRSSGMNATRNTSSGTITSGTTSSGSTSSGSLGTSPLLHTSKYSFAGKEKDKESSLQYFEWRYYDGVSGRFSSIDPIYYELGITKRGKEALLFPDTMLPLLNLPPKQPPPLPSQKDS